MAKRFKSNGNILIDTTSPRFRNKGLQKAERLIARSLCAKCREGYYKATLSILINDEKIGKIISFTKHSCYAPCITSSFSLQSKWESMPEELDWNLDSYYSTDDLRHWYYTRHKEHAPLLYPWRKRGNCFFLTVKEYGQMARKELKKGEFDIVKLFVEEDLSVFVRA